MPALTWRQVALRALDEAGPRRGPFTAARLYAEAEKIVASPLSRQEKAALRRALDQVADKVGKGQWRRRKPGRRPKSRVNGPIASIRDTLEAMAAALREAGYDARARTHENADKTIDGEVRVFSQPRVPTPQTITRLQKLAKALPEVWATLAMIRPAKEEEITTGKIRLRDGYGIKGQFRWRRATPHKLPLLFLAASESDRQSAKKRRRKVEQIAFKYHWNPENQKPSNIGR